MINRPNHLGLTRNLCIHRLLSLKPRPKRRHYLPFANAFAPSVDSGWPPIPHSPLFTFSIMTQVIARRCSPPMETIASVSFLIICSFCWVVKTSSMSLTWINGISFTAEVDLALLVPFLCAALQTTPPAHTALSRWPHEYSYARPSPTRRSLTRALPSVSERTRHST